jgi:hypothetical protein
LSTCLCCSILGSSWHLGHLKYTFGCAQPGFPGIYTWYSCEQRTHDWIKHIVCNEESGGLLLPFVLAPRENLISTSPSLLTVTVLRQEVGKSSAGFLQFTG